MLEAMDAPALRRWAVVSRNAFAARRSVIDGLNVFPVDDGDTGTNLYLTLDGALDAVRAGSGDGDPAGLLPESEVLARAVLLSARGNSGVIVSQLIRGFADEVGDRAAESIDAQGLASALVRAAEKARQAVTHPVEGTILTVATATAEAARRAATDGCTLAQLTPTCVAAARDALVETPRQLDVLARAGVVDAGGAGYLLLMEALDRVVRDVVPMTHYVLDDVVGAVPAQPAAGTGPDSRPGRGPDGHGGHPARAADGPDDADGARETRGGTAAYEVMFLLDDTDDARVGRLTAALDGLGDSLIVVGGPQLWNVHVHTDDPGAAVEAALTAGRPHRVRISSLTPVAPPAAPRRDVGVVACAAGPGIARLLEEAGATTVASGPGRRASAGEILDAVQAARARDVILLPNDRDTMMSAEAAASAAAQEGTTVHVIPSTTAVQGVAALAVLVPDAPVDRSVLAMTRAAAATRHGGTTVAVRAGLTSAGPCEVGDVLGAVGGDFAVVGSDHVAVAEDVITRLLTGGGDLVTVLVGKDAPAGLADAVTRAAHAVRREVEVHVLDGGQPHYELLIGVE